MRKSIYIEGYVKEGTKGREETNSKREEGGSEAQLP